MKKSSSAQNVPLFDPGKQNQRAYRLLMEALRCYENSKKLRGKSATTGMKSKAEFEKAKSAIKQLNKEKFPDAIFKGQEINQLSVEKIKELLEKMRQEVEIQGLQGKAIGRSSSEKLVQDVIQTSADTETNNILID